MQTGWLTKLKELTNLLLSGGGTLPAEAGWIHLNLAHIRYRNGNVTQAFETISRGHDNFKANLDEYAGMLPSEYEQQLRCHIFAPLANPDNKGRPILLWRFGLWDPNKYSFRQLVNSTVFVQDLIMNRQAATLSGVVVFVDFKGFGFRQLISLTKGCIQYLSLFQDVSPLKLKNIHVVNSGSFFSRIYSWVSPLLKNKIKERLIVHPDFSTLYSYINQNSLPSEYGGTGPGLEEGFVEEILKTEDRYKSTWQAMKTLTLNS